jgi:glycopeptide antibiotics resistance protein
VLKNHWKAVFIVYILLLVNFIILKFTGDVDSVLTTIQNNRERSAHGEIAVNFIPFRTIRGYISDLAYGISFINLFGNIVPFIPMGFIVPMAFPSLRSGLKTMTACFLLICSIEILQGISFLGSFDVDDIILNFSSCYIGFMVFAAYKQVFKAALQ